MYATATASCCDPSPATRHLSYIVVEEKRMLHRAQESRHSMHPWLTEPREALEKIKVELGKRKVSENRSQTLPTAVKSLQTGI